MTICEWCGHEHAREALCSQRPKWSRRGFLALMGAAAVGMATDPLKAIVPQASPWTAAMRYAITVTWDVDTDMYALAVADPQEAIK